MKPQLQELMKKICHKNVFIVAGGPSIKKQNLSLLHNQLTIAINNSYNILPNATALYWSDASWIDKHYEQVNQHSCSLRFHARHNKMVDDTDYRGLADSTILYREAEMGLSDNPNFVSGNNGGAHALNLAINMKARNIVLLGYDMQISDNKDTHWHHGHGYGLRPEIYPNSFIPCINSIAKCVKERNLNVNIINASPDTALTCFTMGLFEDYLT